MEITKMIITFPKNLHRELKIRAAKENISMNSRVIKALESDFKRSKNNDDLLHDDYQDCKSPVGRTLKK